MNLPLAGVGKASEEGVVRALDDLFGPSFREVGQYLADKVRFHRQRSLEKVLRRARQINNDEPYLAAPDLKFFLPFVERASLEAAPELVELWSRLLDSEMSERNSHHIHFQEVIGRLGTQEVELFEDLILRPARRRGALSIIEDAYSFASPDRVSRIIKVNSLDEPPDVFDTVAGLTESMGRRIIYYIGVSRRDDREIWSEEPWPSAVKHRSSLQLLRQLGLVDFVKAEGILTSRFSHELEMAFVTELGAEFFFATHPREWRLPPGDRKPDTYPDDGFVSDLDYAPPESKREASPGGSEVPE